MKPANAGVLTPVKSQDLLSTVHGACNDKIKSKKTNNHSMNTLGTKIINVCSKLLDNQWTLAGLLIISIFTVVYGITLVRSGMMPSTPDKKPSINYIQEYSGDEKCQRGLHFLIALNKLWLSTSTAPDPEQVPGGQCTTGNSGLFGVSLTIRVSLTF